MNLLAFMLCLLFPLDAYCVMLGGTTGRVTVSTEGSTGETPGRSQYSSGTSCVLNILTESTLNGLCGDNDATHAVGGTWRYSSTVPDGSPASAISFEQNTTSMSYPCDNTDNCGPTVVSTTDLESTSFMAGGWFKTEEGTHTVFHQFDYINTSGAFANGEAATWILPTGSGKIHKAAFTDGTLAVYTGVAPEVGTVVTTAGGEGEVGTVDATGLNKQGLIWKATNSSGTNGWWFYREDDTIEVGQATGTVGDFNTTHDPDTDWHHYVISLDAGGVLRFHVDGVLDCGGACPTLATTQTTDPLVVGDVAGHNFGEEMMGFAYEIFYDTSVPSTKAAITAKVCRIMLDGYDGNADRAARATAYGQCDQ